MDAKAMTVRDILYAGNQYLIPFFQRSYSWRRKHWERLRDDLWALVEDQGNGQHFLGPLVCTSVQRPFGQVPAYQLIDGQQRLTTLTVFLAAIRDVAREHGLDDLAHEIHETYLIHRFKKGLERYKIIPRIGDREALIGIIDGNVAKEQHKLKVVQAWQFYRKSVAERVAHDAPTHLQSLFTALHGKLSMVVITIDSENPYDIFESLNSTGLPLEESDLIRNYMFMQVPMTEQEAFHKAHWEPFETMFDESGDVPAIGLTLFYRNYLMRHGDYAKPKTTFIGFKEANRQRDLSPADQVAELKQFAQYEVQLRRPKACEDPDLRGALGEIAALEITTAHPLLLALLERHGRGEVSKDELLGCLADLSSFVIRRSICGESTRSYGRWFPEAIKSLQGAPRGDLRKYWLRRGWPDDAAFTARLQEFALYRREPKKCRVILEALERSYGHKEKVVLSSLTVEHIMPQTIARGKSATAWKAMLGGQWAAAHEQWLHTLGNLTLTGYNPDMSNKPYDVKRAGLAKSNLVLNHYFATAEAWNGDAICERARKLAAIVARIWSRPEGAAYTPPADTTKDSLTSKERRELRKEYWTGFVESLRERGVFDKLPKASASGSLFFSMGNTVFRLITFANQWKRLIGVALICRGEKGRTNFEILRTEHATIEAEIGEGLLWREMPNGKTFRISLRLLEADTQNKSAWQQQYEWLADNVETFYTVFFKRCQSMVPSGTDSRPRQALRKEFWTTLLERASHRTDLHAGISPGVHAWVGTGAGMAGLAYNYVIRKDGAKAELYIDRGKGGQADNKRIFDAVKAHQSEIEAAFGGPLAWERLDAKRASRIAYRGEHGGYCSPKEMWPDIQDAMIDAMLRLETALAPHVSALKEKG